MRIRSLFIGLLGVAAIPVHGFGNRWGHLREQLLLLLHQLLFAMQSAWRLFVYRREMLFAKGR